MAVTVAQVIAFLQRKRYPCAILDTDSVTGFCTDALRDLTAYKPLEAVALFDTVGDAQDYLIFDDTKPEGVAKGAISVLEVIWSPSGDIVGSNNLFSVGYRLLDILNLDQTAFEKSADTDAFRRELTTWNRQFGSGTTSWEIIGQPGDPAAILRLSPVPVFDGVKVLVRFTSPWLLSQITGLETSTWGRYLLMVVEMHAAEAAANEEAQSAGVDLAGFKPGKEGLRHWDNKFAEKQKKVLDVLGGANSGLIERS